MERTTVDGIIKILPTERSVGRGALGVIMVMILRNISYNLLLRSLKFNFLIIREKFVLVFIGFLGLQSKRGHFDVSLEK